jgi:hypothetical protein
MTAASAPCPPRLDFWLAVGFVPRSLPREKFAPIDLKIESKFGYADGTQPPRSKR